MNRGAWTGMAVLLLLWLLPMAVGDVTEAQEGDCTILVNGVDAQTISGTEGTGALAVASNSTVNLTITTNHTVTSYGFHMRYGPASIPILESPAAGIAAIRNQTIALNIADYTPYGKGLYRIVGNTTQVDPIHRSEPHGCAVSVLVYVTGNPLTTVAGIAALGAGIGGTAGIVQTAVGGYQDSKEVIDSVKDFREAMKEMHSLRRK